MNGLLGHTTLISPAQLEFFSGDYPIVIIPLEFLGSIPLVFGTIGPLKPNEEVTVPLWLAIVLRKSYQCRIKQPSWLCTAFLEQLLEQENTRDIVEREFHLPYCWMEVAKVLLDNASEDFAKILRIRDLLDRIWFKRSNKAKDNLLSISRVSDVASIDLTSLNAGGMEINFIRPFLVGTMSQIGCLNGQEYEEAPSRQRGREFVASEHTQNPHHHSTAHDDDGNHETLSQPKKFHME